MLQLKNFEGQIFTSSTGTEYVCVGYGIGSDATSAFLVGANYDAVSDKTTFKTILLRDVTMKGAPTP